MFHLSAHDFPSDAFRILTVSENSCSLRSDIARSFLPISSRLACWQSGQNPDTWTCSAVARNPVF